jgi:hypothetical protein
VRTYSLLSFSDDSETHGGRKGVRVVRLDLPIQPAPHEQDAPVATSTTNIPTATGQIFMQIHTLEAATKAFDFDKVRVKITGLAT